MFRWYSFDNLVFISYDRSGIEDMQSDEAELYASYRDDNEAVDNEWLYGQEIEFESDSDDSEIHVPLWTAQFKPSNCVGKRSVDGPSANHNEQ